MALARIPLSWFQTVTAWLNGMSIEGGRVEWTPAGIKLYPYTDTTPPGSGGLYSFQAKQTSPTTISMEPGDITLWPCSFIDWIDIDGYDTTPSVTYASTHVWLEVRVDSDPTITGALGAGYAWMKVGIKSDMRGALDSTEILTKVVVPLVETTWTDEVDPDDNVITAVKNLYCGDAFIARAAG